MPWCVCGCEREREVAARSAVWAWSGLLCFLRHCAIRSYFAHQRTRRFSPIHPFTHSPIHSLTLTHSPPPPPPPPPPPSPTSANPHQMPAPADNAHCCILTASEAARQVRANQGQDAP
ncbi:hypothetical protein K504DRAFT_218450 [Pleomassaria siparia CBS 279.74]|uniref:Uncharacterized protein n=1 Tax=Pleomassaria siparia CBS 279.74 TaxID=1314801 RepID=A0A6G1KEX4_9PLEO|nr:hypothetical protein K504DRAFT_218450 [Pleomassaria siparia CBS 279.74]